MPCGPTSIQYYAWLHYFPLCRVVSPPSTGQQEATAIALHCSITFEFLEQDGMTLDEIDITVVDYTQGFITDAETFADMNHLVSDTNCR